jgi:hypothetical protein
MVGIMDAQGFDVKASRFGAAKSGVENAGEDARAPAPSFRRRGSLVAHFQIWKMLTDPPRC